MDRCWISFTQNLLICLLVTTSRVKEWNSLLGNSESASTSGISKIIQSPTNLRRPLISQRSGTIRKTLNAKSSKFSFRKDLSLTIRNIMKLKKSKKKNLIKAYQNMTQRMRMFKSSSSRLSTFQRVQVIQWGLSSIPRMRQ